MKILKRISHISIFLALIMVLKSVLSVFMRSLIAKEFGAGIETDAYYAAFTIPQQLSDFFIGGILFAAIIPVFQKRCVDAGEKQAAEEISSLLNISTVLLVACSILYLLVTPFVIRTVFSGFDTEKQALATKYSRFFSPLIVLFGLSLIYSSLYHSFRDFFLPSLSALIYPASSIVSLYLLPASLGIERLVYGNLFGAFLGIAVLVIFIRKRIPWIWSWSHNNPLIVAIFALSWPVVIENLFLKFAIFIKNRIISLLPINGALTMIELNLFIVHSIGIFIAGPISTAIFPFLGQQEAQDVRGELVASFHRTLSTIFFIAIPFNVFMIFESESLIRLLFWHGRFSDAECVTTARLVTITSFVILPNCIQSLTGRMFFVLQYTKLPSIVSSVLMMLGAVICYFAATTYGIYGFMVAATFGTYLGGFCNFLLLMAKLGWPFNSRIFNSLFKSVSAGLLMAVALVFAKKFPPFETASIIFRFVIMSSIGASIYLLASWIFQHEDLNYLIKILFRRHINEVIKEKIG